MKFIKTFATIFILLTAIVGHSQQSIVFEKTYRTETDDTVIMALTGAQTSDGGYLLGGYAAYGMYLAQMMFFKIDSVGNYQWKKMYGSLPCSSNMIYDMELVGDGTFICCGEGTFSTEGEPGDLKPNNTMIMRVDENANILWHKEFDTGVMEHLRELAVSDTGYICVGSTATDDKYTDNLLWITGDLDGVYSNTKILNYGYMSQHFRGVAKMPDGNFVIGGHNWGNSFLFKVNQIGDTIQTMLLAEEQPSQRTIVDVGFTNKLLFCGSYIEDNHYTKVDAFFSFCDINFGNIEYFFYEHENELQYAYSQKIVTENDNCFLIVGSIRTSDRSDDFWIKKHDSNGQLLWKRYVGGESLEGLRDVIKTDDNGYLIIGESESFNQYVSMYIVKMDSLGLGNYTSPVENYIIKNNEFLIYPNPVSDLLYIESQGNETVKEIKIYDIYGRVILTKKTSESQIIIDVSGIENGLYILETDNVYSGKIVIQN